MSFSNLAGILEQYTGADPGHGEAKTVQDFDRVSQATPQPNLAQGLADAFRSNQTPPFAQMVSTLFRNSDGQQRAGILNHLLGSLPAGSGMGALAGILGAGAAPGSQVTAAEAASVDPDAVHQMAEQAEKSNPSIIDQASNFYAQHPTLVKALGAGSLAFLMSRISRTS